MLKTLLTFLLFVAAPSACQAYLGGTLEAIETKTAESHASYTVYILRTDSYEVREFVAQNQIFAITWKGLDHPVLETLLGKKYYPQYQKLSATQAAPIESAHGRSTMRSHAIMSFGNRHRHFKTDSLDLRLDSRMRFFSGDVFDPSQMPKGVSSDEIK